MRSKDQILLENNYLKIYEANIVRGYWQNDILFNEEAAQSGLNSIIQNLILKLKEIDPNLFNNLIDAINSKDPEKINQLFNNGQVNAQQQAITQQIAQSPEPVSEAFNVGSLIKTSWNWIQNNKIKTGVAILGIIAAILIPTVGFSGIGSWILNEIEARGLSIAGVTLASAAYAGVKDLVQKKGLKTAAKDALEKGEATIASKITGQGIGDEIGDVTGVVSSVIGTITNDQLTKLLKGDENQKALAQSLQSKNISDEQKKILSDIVKQHDAGKITKNELSFIKNGLDLLSSGKLSPEEITKFNSILNVLIS